MADKILNSIIFNYGILPKDVMKNPNLSIQAKAIYAYLCVYAGNKEASFPGEKLIRHELNISKDTFYKYLSELKKIGYVEVEKNRTEEGRFSHNVYCLKSDPCPKIPDTVLPDTTIPDTINSDTNINNTKSNNNIYPQDFSEWYESYPNKFNKNRTFKNWKNTVKKDSKENVVIATNQYKQYIKKNNISPQYIIRSTNFVGQHQEYKGYLEMAKESEKEKKKVKPIKIVERDYL